MSRTTKVQQRVRSTISYVRPKFRIQRPSRPGQDFPLIRFFWFTGEELNPWRCENCLTDRQRKDLPVELTDEHLRPENTPKLCRKCGVDFY